MLDRADQALNEQLGGPEAQDRLANSAMKHIAQRQEYDLLGLSLQIPGNEIFQVPLRIQVSACPIHNALFQENLSSAIPMQGSAAMSMLSFTSIDRYLAEGLAERYAIYSASGTGEWARYHGCQCAVE